MEVLTVVFSKLLAGEVWSGEPGFAGTTPQDLFRFFRKNRKGVQVL